MVPTALDAPLVDSAAIHVPRESAVPVAVASKQSCTASAVVEPDIAAPSRIDRLTRQFERLAVLLRTDADYVVEPFGEPLPDGFKLSVVMPVYNEKQTIREIAARVLALPIPLELIVVDDGSRDGTRDVLMQLQEASQVTVFFKDRNEGKGAALRDGVQLATGDIVAVQDADLEYDPRDLLGVIRPVLRGDAEVAYGSRFLATSPKRSSWLHRSGNRLLTRLSNLVSGLKLTDMETCHKAFRAEVIRELPLSQNRFGFEPEVTAKIARRGHRIVETPVSYHPRRRREGKKIGLRDAITALWCIVRYRVAD
jgi:glycosyltransferase involved in cell wall biosynthesis